MRALNKDTIVAILLLAFCGLLAWSSLHIRLPGYGTLKPSTWPQIIVAVLTLFSAIYFVQSLGYARDASSKEDGRRPGVSGFLEYFRNPIICFAIYFVFLATLPWTGALIGGIALVFALLTVLGGWSARDLVRHAIYAVVSMGFMWTLFTFGLRVILPEGEIFSIR